MADLSTYMTITNHTPYTLSFTNKTSKHGYWEVNPPNSVPAFGVTSQFNMKDHSGAASGTEGTMTYSITLPRHHTIIDPTSLSPSTDTSLNLGAVANFSVDSSANNANTITTPLNDTKDDKKVVTFTMRFCDSWSANNNYCYFGASDLEVFSILFTARIDDGPWHNNYCPESGHPLKLHFVIRMLGR